MDLNLKKLIEEISPRLTKEIIEDHVKEVIVDIEKKIVTITIDRKYALHQLSTHEHIWNVIKWVKNSFWEDFETIIKSIDHSVWRYWNEHHDREINIPQMIHYG